MQVKVQNQNILITGATGGIGRSIVKSFDGDNNNLLIIGTNENKLNALSQELKSSTKYLACDFNDYRKVKKITTKINEELDNKIDILINNAGITGSTAELWNYDYEEWKKIININLHGTFNCCKSVVPHMIKNNYGRIVNIASVSGKDGNAKASAYSSSKAGVIALTKSLGKELADKNIAVNAVTPAGAKTRILDQMSKEHVQRMLSKVPRARFLELEELTSMVCWLSSAENSFSTAAVFDISGGRSTY